MTRDERKLVSHLTAKVPSEQLADILSSIDLEEIDQIFEKGYEKVKQSTFETIMETMMEAFDALSTHEEDLDKRGDELVRACEITGPIVFNEGHLIFGGYTSESTFRTPMEARLFIALTAAKYVELC